MYHKVESRGRQTPSNMAESIKIQQHRNAIEMNGNQKIDIPSFGQTLSKFNGGQITMEQKNRVVNQQKLNNYAI